MAVRRRTNTASSGVLDDPMDAVSWAVAFANAELTEENWKEYLWNWFRVSFHDDDGQAPEAADPGVPGKRSPRWHYGGMGPTLTHIHRTQESIRETLEALADRGNIPREIVERVNSYLMGLYGFKFHIITELPDDNETAREANRPLQPGAEGAPSESGNNGGELESPETQKGIQPQTLRLEPKTNDLRSLFYYKFSLFLISAAARRIRKCKKCGGYFIQRFNHRKLYCSDLCRFRLHNEARGRKVQPEQKDAATAGEDDNQVWWLKYEGNSPSK